MKHLTIVAIVLSASAFAQQNDVKYTDEMKRQNTEMVNTFSRCHAVYEFTAELFRRNGQPALAETTHQMANGARSAATYLLGQENIILGGPRRTYGSFDQYVDGIAETEVARLAALLEGDDQAALKAALEQCAALASVQEEIVQAIRNEINARQ